MLLKNYLNLFNTWLTRTGLSYTASVKDTAGNNILDRPYDTGSSSSCISLNMALAQAEGRTGTLYIISNNSLLYYGNSSGNATWGPYTGVIIGDGDVVPTVDDYSLSGNQITDFSATTAIASSVDNGKISIVGTYNITNTGASPFTIKEIGTSKISKETTARVLLTRDLLATPVTIAPGDTGVVTYKIEIS